MNNWGNQAELARGHRSRGEHACEHHLCEGAPGVQHAASSFTQVPLVPVQDVPAALGVPPPGQVIAAAPKPSGLPQVVAAASEGARVRRAVRRDTARA